MLLNACSNSSVCKMFWGAVKAPLKCDKTELQNWRNVSNCIFPRCCLVSSVNVHPFAFHLLQYIPKAACALPGRPLRTYRLHTPPPPPQDTVVIISRGRIKRRKGADQVPYFSWRSWWKVSLNETHSKRDPVVILKRREEELELVPGGWLFCWLWKISPLDHAPKETKTRQDDSGGTGAS